MFRKFSSRVHRALLRFTANSQRRIPVEPVETQNIGPNGNTSASTIHSRKNVVHQQSIIRSNSKDFDLKHLFDKWRERFQSSSKNDRPVFKDDFLMWCTGILCLSSVIVGHKWVYRRNTDNECPIHYLTKDVLNHILLHSIPLNRLLFAVNPDNVPALVQSSDKSELLLEDQINIDQLDEVVGSFKAVANQCNGSLLNHLAIKLAEANEHEKAFQMLKEASLLGNATASYNLGISYEHALGTKKCYKKAAECYEKAGNKNHIKSLYNLASLCYGGFLGDYSQEKGFTYAKRAADLGMPQAQLFVGLRYTEQKDWNKAFKYFQMAAQQNDATSMFNLAICYENGYGTSLDVSKAMGLYRKGAARGHVMSQFCLADSYQYGSRGVLKDLKESMKWFQLAKKNCHPEADLRIEHIQYELKQQSEDKLLTLLESNTLLEVLQPVKQVIETTANFHKSSSMPSLQKLHNNNNNHTIASSTEEFHGKTFHKSLLLLSEQSLTFTGSKRPGYFGMVRDLPTLL